MALPNTKVEIAFNAGYTTPAASRTWTDVSTYVEAKPALTITRGRPDESGQVQPSVMSLTLNNKDGRFTPEKTSGAYYPNVKKGRPIRVTSTYNAVAYTRFVGYINEWPVTWPDSTDSASEVTITASSRMARLGVGATLPSFVEAVARAEGPSAYYGLGEPAESTSASDTSGFNQPQLTQAGNGTAVEFGSGTGPSGDSQTAATFAAGKYLSAPVIFASVPTAVTVEGFFASTTDGIPIFRLRDVTGGGNTNPAVGLLGTIRMISAAATTTSGTNGSDGLVHHVAMILTTTSASLYVDGVLVGTTAFSSAVLTQTMTLEVGGVSSSYYFGGAGFLNGDLYTGTIAHVGVYNGALTAGEIASIADAGLTGMSGDLSGSRIGLYATLAGIPSAEQVIDTGTAAIATVDTTGQTPVALMQKVVETENGILYDAKDSTGSLVFKDRDHRYNLASTFTLNATTQEVQGDLQPRLDDQFLVNEVTATSGDLTARVVDATSTADYGFYRQSLDVATMTLDETRALAEWRVGLNDQPTTRYPTVSVDVVNIDTAQAALVLAADISTRFGLSALPAQAPATTADFFIEGYTEAITESRHLITFNTSPTTGYAGAAGVWQLDVNNIDGPYVLAL